MKGKPNVGEKDSTFNGVPGANVKFLFLNQNVMLCLER